MASRPTASTIILGTDTNNALDPWMTHLVVCGARLDLLNRGGEALDGGDSTARVVDHTSALFRQNRPFPFLHWR